MSSLPPTRGKAPATAAARVALRERRSVSRSRSPLRGAPSPNHHHHAPSPAPSLPGTSRFAPPSSVATAATGAGGGGEAVAAAAAAAAAASAPAVDEHNHGLEAIYPPPARVSADADVKSLEQYREMWRQSLDDPAKFWGELAERDFYWHKKWDDVFTRHNFDMRKGPITSEWFIGAETNLCYNCVDRHVEAGLGDRVAFLWEGNDVDQSSKMTYRELQEHVVRLSNWLRDVAGVRKGDDVTLYMPMVPELPAAMLACARLGAVHSVVFGGFSADALAARLADSKSKVVLTASAVRRGAKPIPLKSVVDSAVKKCASMEGGHAVERVLVLDKPEAAARADVPFVEGRDAWWHDTLAKQSSDPSSSPIEWVDAEHPLFKLYTSGSTGKPKGVIHSTAGYMVGTATTFKYVFDYKPGKDVYWCTADCGWITGHSYVTYGPLLHAATQVLFEGVPTFPDAGRMWQIVEKHGVTQLYTAPTAIRALESLGDDFVTRYDRSSLRVLGSVGEPIGPQAWRWYHDVVGGNNNNNGKNNAAADADESGVAGGNCPIVDTWWQTETGAHMITPLPGATPLKPGSATLPFFGVEPALLDENGKEIEGPGQGVLVIKRSWPSALRSLAGDQERFEQTYFAPYKGYYFSGDGARRDEDGYYWLVGRVDDVINVSGHRIGTAEVEAALTEHPLCAEAAVVPVEHPIKGQGIYAFVTLMAGTPYPPPESVRRELVDQVRASIGAIATPDAIHWAPGLPKTRSGKIMRRILRKIASREEGQLGDTSTLADPGVVQTLIDLRPAAAAPPAKK